MSYEQFVQEVETMIQTKVGEKYKVYIYTATKNNGLIRKGITFVEKGNNVAPTIYLEEFYERYIDCENVEVIAEQIIEQYEEVSIPHASDFDFITDFEKVRDKIIVRLINREANWRLLEEVPYTPYLDLAIVYQVLAAIDEAGDHLATMLIRNEHMEMWNISEEDLFACGVINSQILLPAEMTGMHMLISEMLPEWEKTEYELEEEFMYVLTNNRRCFGACTILYPEQLKAIYMLLEEGFYVLPSSIHEVIILPESRAVEKDKLYQIVFEINHMQVPKEEVLSDNVYYYDARNDVLVI